MKKLLKTSVTKIVFLMLSGVACFIAIWNTIKWLDNQSFETILSMTFAFYFWQKAIQYNKTDSIIDEEEKSE